MIRYTLGFIFSEDKKEVLLLKINKPEKWNDGLINGIGGKVEENETINECMFRECKEETGLNLLFIKYCGLYDGSNFTGNEFEVYTYYTVLDKFLFKEFDSPEGELKWYNVKDIMDLKTVPNMKWMIPLCLDMINGDVKKDFNIKYC